MRSLSRVNSLLYNKPKHFNKGSITIEASIALPIFMGLILSLTFIIRIAVAHQVIQHAINDAASELATYSYVYTASGLKDKHDGLKDKLNDNGTIAEKDFTTILNAWDNFSNKSQDLTNVSLPTNTSEAIEVVNKFNEAGSDISTTSSEVLELVKRIGRDPKKELLSIGSLLGDCLFEDTKGALIVQPIAGYMINKNLEKEGKTADSRLKALGVVNGFNGLDLSDSTIFKDKQSIDLIVKYKIKIPVPLNIFPDFYIIQRAKVQAWLGGEGEGWDKKYVGGDNSTVEKPSVTPSSTPSASSGSASPKPTPSPTPSVKKTVWDLEAKSRGKEIQKQEGRNLPDMFPVVAKKYGDSIYSIKSMDLNEATYLNSSKLKYRINGLIKELDEFKYSQYTETKDCKYKVLVIIVPKDSINSMNQKVFNECVQKANSLNIKLEIKEHPEKKSEG